MITDGRPDHGDIVFVNGLIMFGRLIEFVLNGISPRNGRCYSNPHRNFIHNEDCAPIHKRAKAKNSHGNDVEIRGFSFGNIAFNNFRKSVFFYPLTGVLVMIISGLFFRPLLVTLCFISAAFISRIYQKHIRLQIGIDLGLFGTVICAALYGPIVGAVVGILAYLSSIFYTDEDPKYLPVVLLGIVIVGIVAGVANISAMNIIYWGVGLTLIYNVFTGVIFMSVYKSNIISCIIFCVTHVWFNYVVFSWVGARILYLLM